MNICPLIKEKKWRAKSAAVKIRLVRRGGKNGMQKNMTPCCVSLLHFGC